MSLFKMRSYWNRVGPYCSMTGVLIKGRNSETDIYTRSMYAKLIQFCLTLCNRMDSSLPGSPVHGHSPARILEWVAMPFSRGSSQATIEPTSHVSCIGTWILYHECQLGSPYTGRTLCKDEGRDQGDAPIRHGTRMRAPKHQKLGERPETDSPAQPKKEPALPTETFTPPEP